MDRDRSVSGRTTISRESNTPTDSGPTADVRDPPPGSRSLIVLDPEHPERTVRTVLRDPAALVGAPTLLFVHPTAEYEARRRARQQTGVPGEYPITELETAARLRARRAGRDWLGAAGQAFDTVGAVGRLRDVVAATVADGTYARVYVDSPEPSWWRRLLGATATATDLARRLPANVAVVPVDAVGDAAPSASMDDVSDGRLEPER